MKKIPAPPSLVRKVERIQPKVELVIACEGRNTEPDYLRDCIAHYSAGLVQLRILKHGATPQVLVRAAIAERKSLIEKYRRSKDSFDCCFKVWAIFDRDEHDYVEESLAEADAAGIEVAFSNPCFELWAILHLVDYGSQDGRHQLQRRLSQIMPKYDHAKEARIDYGLIANDVETAISRAEVLAKARHAEGSPNGSPVTTVHKLVQKIIQNGKLANRKTK